MLQTLFLGFISNYFPFLHLKYNMQHKHIRFNQQDKLKPNFVCMQVGLQRTLCDITDGWKFLFFDLHQRTANGESVLQCLQITMDYSYNSNYC